MSSINWMPLPWNVAVTKQKVFETRELGVVHRRALAACDIWWNNREDEAVYVSPGSWGSLCGSEEGFSSRIRLCRASY